MLLFVSFYLNRQLGDRSLEIWAILTATQIARETPLTHVGMFLCILHKHSTIHFWCPVLCGSHVSLLELIEFRWLKNITNPRKTRFSFIIWSFAEMTFHPSAVSPESIMRLRMFSFLSSQRGTVDWLGLQCDWFRAWHGRLRGVSCLMMVCVLVERLIWSEWVICGVLGSFGLDCN